MLTFKDVSLEKEPIGLAEKLAQLKKSINILIETPEVPDFKKKYHLAVELVTGDMCELAGKVIDRPKNDRYVFMIEECDEKFAELLAKLVLEPAEKKPDSDDLPVWGGGVRQTNDSYAFIVNSPAGIYNAAQLQALTDIVSRGHGVAKVTHAQRFLMLVKPEQLENIEEILKSVNLRKGVLHHGVRNIRACAGSLCKWTINNDAVGLALEIDKNLYGFPAKFDIKIAISDCNRNCSESYCADIGLIGLDGNYRVVVGGRGASIPFRAIELLPHIEKSKVLPFMAKFVEWYKNAANERERLCKTLQRLGGDLFKAKDEKERMTVKNAFENIDRCACSGDCISEGNRLFEQYLRGLAVDNIRNMFLEV